MFSIMEQQLEEQLGRELEKLRQRWWALGRAERIAELKAEIEKLKQKIAEKEKSQ